jgi:hypothetical protein
MSRIEKYVLTIAIATAVVLVTLSALIPGLDMQTRINMAGIAGPIIGISMGRYTRQFLKRSGNGRAAK